MSKSKDYPVYESNILRDLLPILKKSSLIALKKQNTQKRIRPIFFILVLQMDSSCF